MILQALVAYADAQGTAPLGYESKPVGFELVLRRDGRRGYLQTLHQSDAAGRVRAPRDFVPNLSRSNNPPALLGCDTASFVLGLPKPLRSAKASTGRPVLWAFGASGWEIGGELEPDHLESLEAESTREQNAATQKQVKFLELLGKYQEQCDDEDVAVFRSWVDSGMPGLSDAMGNLSEFERGRLDVELVAVRVEGSQRLHSKPGAQAFWGDRVSVLKASGNRGLCLCCGQPGILVDTFPQSLVGSRIPATSRAEVALVSTNFASASRGATGTGLKSAPVCLACATKSVAAFNELSAHRDHRWNFGSTSACIWWSTSPSLDEAILSLDDPMPEKIRVLLHSVLSGRRTASEIPGEFYMLTFSGNVSRLSIHAFYDFPLKAIAPNIHAWFQDTATDDDERPYRRLADIAASAGRFIVGESDPHPPEGSIEALLLTAVTGARPPASLLLPAISRARAEVHRMNAEGLAGWTTRQRALNRLALIRLILNRSEQKEGTSMTAGLDETRDVPAYLCGRLFAVRASLQYLAVGEVNSSLVDRFFARASAHPASVEHSLAVLEQQHLRALRRRNQAGVAVNVDKEISDLHDRIGVAPGRLSTEEQAEWIAGFYQQRTENFRRSLARRQSATEHSEEN